MKTIATLVTFSALFALTAVNAADVVNTCSQDQIKKFNDLFNAKITSCDTITLEFADASNSALKKACAGCADVFSLVQSPDFKCRTPTTTEVEFMNICKAITATKPAVTPAPAAATSVAPSAAPVASAAPAASAEPSVADGSSSAASGATVTEPTVADETNTEAPAPAAIPAATPKPSSGAAGVSAAISSMVLAVGAYFTM